MTKYDKTVKENAFKLYALGIPMERIAKKVNISKPTLYKWKKQEKWGNRKNKITKQTIKKVNETITEIKTKQLNLIREIEDTFNKQMKLGKNIKTSEIIQALKHELHLLGEAETSTEDKKLIELIKKLDELHKK